MTNTVMTFEQFQDALVEAAKDIQGDNYAGDDYYRQESWREYWEDGDDPRDTVISDMGYWEE